MRKIPTIFERDWNCDRSRVLDVLNPACGWVFAGEGVATVKLDGTCCMIRNGKLFKRRELKLGEPVPAEMVRETIIADHDEQTGKTIAWVPVGDGSEDQYHQEALRGLLWPDGTYELIGPKVQGNPEKEPRHTLARHGAEHLDAVPRTFNELRDYLRGKDIEGIVWYHPDGRMAKIKLRDFGLKRGG